MSDDTLNSITPATLDVNMLSADHIHADETTTTATDENLAPSIQRVKSSNLLRTSPIIPAETKKRKRADEDDYTNAFTDATNIHSNSDVPLSPSESPTKKRKKMTDEEKAERERQRLEREEKRQQELKEKAERKLKKEEERKQREEEKRKKDEEREEQRRQREEEKRKKEEEKKKREEDKEKQRLEREEEKRKKEEERKKKEEDKRKKEEEKKKKEEEKERAEEEKKRQAEKKKAYWGQFKANSTTEVTAASTSLQSSRELTVHTGERGWSTELFRAWQPAAGAVIAPLHRWQSLDTNSFEHQLTAQNAQVSIASLPKRARVTRRSVLAARKARRTSHYQQVIDLSGAADPQLNPLTDRLLHARFKYLNFHENVRPAYYGTFTAQCRRITGRRPFGKEESVFGDYSYDSDEDWEEEEGEDLDALSERSEEEPLANTNNKEETEEDYCYDGEFLVADGYLSDEEGLKSDNDDEDDERDPLQSPADLAPKTEEERAREAERRQERMKKMMAHKKRVAECQAVVAGPIYHPSSAEDRVRALIMCYPVELLAAQSIDPRVPLAEELDEEIASVAATPNKAKVVPDTLVPDLIRILHGASSRSHVIDTFHKLHPHISKRQIERKIAEIASRGQVDDSKQGWVVRPEIVARYTSALPNSEVKQRSSDTSTDSPHESSAVVDTCHHEVLIQ